MKNRTVLSFFGLVIVAGIVALIVAIRGGGDTPQQSKASASQKAPASTALNGTRVAPRVRSEKPVKQNRGDTTVAERPPTVFMTDGGVLVRDHRRNRDRPVDPAGPPRAPKSAPAKMDHKTILAVRGALRPIVNRCQAEPANAAEPSTLQVVATVTVTNEELTVDAVEVSESSENGITGECVRENFTGLRLPAPGEPDVSGFKQTHKFRLKSGAASNAER